MLEALGTEALILTVSIGGSLVGLGAVALMLHKNKPDPTRKTLKDIVRDAPYERLGNNLKVLKG